MTKSANERFLDAIRMGFWMRTKQAPYHAVRWEPQRHEDGRQSFRGKNWVEVLPFGEDREPERYHAADVELAGPHEWLTYYPAAGEPICGWGKPRLPHGTMQYCPRYRREQDSHCPKHQAELTPPGEDNHERPEEPSGGLPVSPAQRGAGPAGHPGDGV